MNELINNAGYTPVQYCILKVSGKFLSTKLEIEVDFGKENASIINDNEALVAHTQKVSSYYTIVDALNYMSSLGWEVVHVHHREVSGTTYNNPEYLMKRSLAGK
ncbi:hypothetical protein KHS38_02890 [Mucilaginibacter sp. Bleaf8]|uniref:hypothetical protein n=1 Tax=Mucilaginibacter sp. Bleaf8 TaxID=2834430 RepID=UPI001BCF0E75|nr:hypothetical protein [Mucilaginibacter sp. Bleaf8]MBS7563338.1 hypothetical protein [Mucilaginibacter sp. Bleaf8]